MSVYDHMARAIAFCRAAKLEPELMYPAVPLQAFSVCVHLEPVDLLRLAGDRLEIGDESFGTIVAWVVYDQIKFAACATPDAWRKAILSTGASGMGFPDSVQAAGGSGSLGGVAAAGAPNSSQER